MMVDDAEFKRLFDPEILLTELNEQITGQVPVGMNEEVGMVMDVAETTQIVQVWIMKHFALMAQLHWENSGQFLQATSNVIAVSALHMVAVRNAITDETL
tara:strand:- start:25372 stop:25671 length:300 start_codon:yes stop_codon:yes gene_type:complete